MKFDFLNEWMIPDTVPTRIVDAATILGFYLFGAATIQTESTIQWVYYYSDFYIESEKMYIFSQKLHFKNKIKQKWYQNR